MSRGWLSCESYYAGAHRYGAEDVYTGIAALCTTDGGTLDPYGSRPLDIFNQSSQ